MMVIATALKHMLAAGMDHDAIVEAVAEMEDALILQQAVAKPRSKGAARQARWREKHRADASQSVTRNAHETLCDDLALHVTPDGGEELPLPPPPPSFPQTPNQPPPPPAPTRDAPAHEGGDDGTGDDGAKAKEKFRIPDWIPADAWKGYEEMRRRIRKPMTDRARTGIVNKLDRLKRDGHPPGAVLDQSTEHSWTGVFELKDQRNGTGNRPSGYDGTGSGRPRNRAEEMDAAMCDLGFDGRF